MALFSAIVLVAPAAGLLPIRPRTEALDNPLGIGTATPRFSWQLAPRDPLSRNLSQSWYEIVVGSRPGADDLWHVNAHSAATYGINYRGRELAPGHLAYWRVRVTDGAGMVSPWSPVSRFSVGKLSERDWQAQWIGYDAPRTVVEPPDPFNGAKWIWHPTPTDAPFEKTFSAAAGFTKATLHITADDQYRVWLNDREVGASDGQTDAWRRPGHLDVTSALRSGENRIRVGAQNSGGAAGLLVRLELEYPDGRKESVVSDESWSNAGEIGAYGIEPWGLVGPRALVLPAPRLLRREFQAPKRIRRATLTGSALGLLELRLNGQRVSDELFMPGWTDYTKRVYSRTYDVTRKVLRGGNALGVVLGDGWYSGYVGYGGRRDHYGKRTRAKVQLDLEYTDGSREIVATDPTWRASTGPVRESDFLMGEVYDARKETAWDRPGFAADGWAAVDTGAEVDPNVEPFPGQPVRPYDELHAKTVREVKPDTYVLDLGQNMAGFARLRVNGREGQKITLRFAERLNPDGTIYTTNLRGARAIDTYVCRNGRQTWEPRFTFHGFQYIEVTGLGHRPGRNEVVGIPISSDTPTTGTIETSDPMLNRLVSNAWWTQRMNFIDVPTDCPQRDERLGWTGDAQAYVRTASMLTDVQPFFTKWLVSLDDAQRADGQYPMVAPLKVAEGDGGPAWADAGVICPWTIYDVYGDRELLARHYPQMRKFVDFCVARSKPNLMPPDSFHCFGDWLQINANTPTTVIYSAYFAGSARLVSQAAAVLGNTEDAAKYGALYERLRRVFVENYVTPDGVVAGNTQCAYILALAFDLLDPALAKMAADRLVADIEARGGHLSTGFVGTRDIMHVLSKIGRNDVAFRLLHNTTFPSWGFTIVNGATSIWERWDGWTPERGFQDPGMNSFAHYAFGAVVGWMFDQPAGIRNLKPGFEVVRVAPQIDPKLRWLRSSYNSVRGTIVSEWQMKGGRLTMRVVVPPNVRAEIVVPAKNVRESTGLRGKGGVFTVGSGEYRFEGDL